MHIRASTGGATAGELAAACGFGSLRVDGRAVDDDCPLAVCGLVDGSELADAAAGPIDDDPPATPRWACAAVTGPDCGPLPPLPPGRHVLGRAPGAALRVQDPHVEPHHALVELGAMGDDGVARAVALVGSGILEAGTSAEGAAIEAGDSCIEIGALRAPPPARRVPPTSGTSWHRDHHRPPRPATPDPPSSVTAPPLPPPRVPTMVPVTLVPALLGALGAGIAAVVLHQPLVLLFGLSAVVAAAGTWTAQQIGRLRRARSDDRERAAALQRFAADVAAQADADANWLRSTTPDVVAALTRIDEHDARLWERRPFHPDAWRVVLGRGQRPWSARLDRELADGDDDLAALVEARAVLRDMPVVIDVGSGCVLGICGAAAAGLARSIVVQLASSNGPADWELVVVTTRPDEWSWIAWLPHETLLLDPAQAASTTFARTTRHRLIVVDAPGALAARTAPLRRALDSDPHPAAVVLADDERALPSCCSSMLTGGFRSARWFSRLERDELPLPVRPAGITVDRAGAAAARLAHLRDPETDGGATSAPASVDLLTVLGDRCADARAIADSWARAGYDPAPVATIGAAADGTIEIDLHRDGPHALIGGTTGAGKSELLRSLVAGLAARTPPSLLSFVLVDYKGGAAFDACAALPHVAGVVTDLDERLAARALRSLDAEVRRRERLLRATGASDLTTHRMLTGGREPLARLVVVVDEFATLAADLPGFLRSLVAVAQRGRSLGVHLVLATQRPGTAISDDIRANTNLRVALRVQDTADAVDVVGDATPAAFGRTAPGRAMLRLGNDERVVFQVAASCGPVPPADAPGVQVAFGEADPAVTDGDGPCQLTELVDRICTAAATHPPARPVWTAPLPDRLLELDGDGADGNLPAVGLVDEPGQQRLRPLIWDHTRGHLLVAGSLGSGTTTTAMTVVRALMARCPPEDLQIYVIGNDERLRELETAPHCGAVVALAERERLERLLRVLRARVDAPPACHTVVVIDGLPAVRTAVDGLGGDLHERFDELLTDGPPAGMTALVTSDQTVLPLAVTARATQRWIMRLADAPSAALLDLPAAETLGEGTPPGRLVALPEHLEAHVVAPEVARRWSVHPGPPAPSITVLPDVVHARTLDPAWRGDGRVHLPIGRDGALLDPAAIDLADGEHVLVLGTPRSGRSSALVRLASAWAESTPEGSVFVVALRPSPLTTCADAEGWRRLPPDRLCEHVHGPRLVVVDDAELLDDPALPRACAADATTVLAASRPDALRGSYQHWTTAVRRSRNGLVLGRPTEQDGDLLGVVLPRRWPVPHGAGRGWLVTGGVCHGIVQVALDDVGGGSPGATFGDSGQRAP